MGRLDPFVSVRIVMPPGLRGRSARYKAAMERDKEESTEDAARDSHAEDTVEDSVGPGPVRDRAHALLTVRLATTVSVSGYGSSIIVGL